MATMARIASRMGVRDKAYFSAKAASSNWSPGRNIPEEISSVSCVMSLSAARVMNYSISSNHQIITFTFNYAMFRYNGYMYFYRLHVYNKDYTIRSQLKLEK